MIASRLLSSTQKTSLKNVTIQYYFITYKGIHRIPSQHLSQSKSTQRQKWPQLLVPFSRLQPLHQSFPPDARCRCFGQNGLGKKNDVIQVEEKRKVEQHWFISCHIHIYIHMICKLKKRLLTKDCCLAWEETLSRNYGMWRSSIEGWMSNQDQHFIRLMVQTSGDHHLECKNPCKKWDELPYQLVQGFLPSTVTFDMLLRERCFFDVSLTMTKPSSLASKARVFKRSSWWPAWTTNNNNFGGN